MLRHVGWLFWIWGAGIMFKASNYNPQPSVQSHSEHSWWLGIPDGLFAWIPVLKKYPHEHFRYVNILLGHVFLEQSAVGCCELNGNDVASLASGCWSAWCSCKLPEGLQKPTKSFGQRVWYMQNVKVLMALGHVTCIHVLPWTCLWLPHEKPPYFLWWVGFPLFVHLWCFKEVNGTRSVSNDGYAIALPMTENSQICSELTPGSSLTM